MSSQNLSISAGRKDSVGVRQYAEVLIRYVANQKRLFAIVAVLLLGSIGLQLANPQILRYFIDEATKGSPLSRLLFAAGLFIGIAVLHKLSTFLPHTQAGGLPGLLQTPCVPIWPVMPFISTCRFTTSTRPAK